MIGWAKDLNLGIPTWAKNAVSASTSAVGGAWSSVQTCMGNLGNCANKLWELASVAGMF